MSDPKETMELQKQDMTEKAPCEDDEIDRLVDDFLSRQTSTSENRGDVVFQDLSVIGAGVGHQLINNVPEACRRLLQLGNPASWSGPAASRVLLHKITGSIREGEMLMVVGRPGSGCTTFLKALANMREEYLAMDGKVWYGLLDAAAAKTNRPDQIAFVGEIDVHFPSLSVGTTLRTLQQDRASIVEQDLQTVLQLMGLDHVAGVRIGSDHIRGVSGGQRRRVSLAEAFCTRASLFCFDNPTRGLDSSTAIRFLTVLRKYTTRSRSTAAMSLYQASDLAVSLFDKILVFNEGHVAYYGPAASAKEYFESLGFYCSSRSSISDFLASMSGTPDGRISRKDIQRPVPLQPFDFEARFWESSFYQQAVEEAKAPQPTSLNIKGSGYALPFYRQFYECTTRHYRIFMTDRAAWIAEAVGTIVQALLLGTLFRNQTAVSEGLYTRCSALLFCVLIMGLQASAEFGNTFVQRPILLKQKALRFYRPGAYALGQIFADIPWKLIFILYSLPIYWMIDFQRTAGHFFTWLICLYMGLMALSVMFRAIAVFKTSITRAILPVGLLLNLLITYTGFYITPPGMKVWLGWIRYLDPMYYIFESIALNEIGGSTYQCSAKDTVPVGLSYDDTNYQTCAVSGSVPGSLELSGKLYLLAEYGFYAIHKWRNVGINAAFFIFFSVLVTIGMERFRHAAAHMSTIYYQKLPWSKASAPTLTDIEKPAMTNEVNMFEKGSETELPANYFEPNKHVFSWQDLTLDLGNGKRLLDNVSGWLQPGSMTALMGMSGAGKRIQIGVLSGGLYLDGGPLPASMGRQTSFVHQNDIHLDSSTMREALQLSARLRRPANISLEEKMAHVEMVIRLLEMEDIADAVIGVPGAGLDLERRKRVSIGVELAAKPDILLFLDEPTSGLDGNSALSIVQLMRKLSHAGQTILCTIHQPSSQMIELFDSLLLLIPGGKTVYFGPLGHQCETIIDYFARYARRCTATENPADYFLDISADPRKDWFQIWQDSPEFGATKEKIQHLLKQKDAVASAGSDRAYAASFLEQLRVVTQRAFTNYWRDSDYVLGKIQLNIWMGLMNGLTFLQLSNNLTDSRGRMFSIFVGVITGTVLSLQIEPRFIILRDQFLARENESRVYHWTVFTISALLVEIPYTLLGGLIYWLLWYYMVGYFTISTRAGYAFLMYELYSLFVASLAQFTAAIFPTTLAAQVATGFVWLVVNTFNGPLSPPPLTPRGWRWFYNISPLYYFIEGIGTNAMHALDITCRSSELSVFNSPSSERCGSYAAAFFSQSNSTGYLVDDSATGQCEYCSYANGDEYVKQYDFSYSQRGRNVGIFIGFILFNYTMAVVATYLIFIVKWRKRTA
ncbi:P-loop containing nucleoside triphosphate hydrolase protein [Penicillium malachiteum]|uniref:P-loop containing nucleoside triphosphate hydrolase protein n=1 Tax=Penicillium malachiteum TaxID=1324776 RepID=A0AAD6HHZ3_9EURO|nr:P-loop containing nucleoside triphosphate hydrolase protein [Penicillium malachiteum]